MSSASRIPPGPRGLALVQAIRFLRRDPLNAMLSFAREYGDLVHLGEGPLHIYMVNHPDLVRDLLVGHAARLRKPRSTTRPVIDFLGSGLLVSEGALWRSERHTMQPVFHHRVIDAYGQEMVACIDAVLAGWHAGDVHDIDEEMLKMTLAMVTRTLFRANVQDAEEMVVRAVKVLQKVSYQQGQLGLPIPRWLPLPGNRQKWHYIDELDVLVARIIQSGRAAGHESGNMIAMLAAGIDQPDSVMTERLLRDEVMTVLLAGHESTANGLTWMWYLLTQHPEVQEQLRAEAEAVLEGRPPTVADFKRLTYAENVVKEALRLYPPAWALPREPLEDIALGDYTLKQGSMVIAAPYVIHRDPRFYPQPDAFIPERFDTDQDTSPFAYIPFGAGPRFCVGTAFAQMAMRMVLVRVQQGFRLTLVPGERVGLDPLLTLRPTNGVHIQMQRWN
ncbi:MAG: cytochrome P450 [Anaerolineae bacterium]|nr:cytochrome P450 [Anaerolineae bacterium]